MDGVTGDTQQLGSVVGLIIMMVYLGWHLFIKKN